MRFDWRQILLVTLLLFCTSTAKSAQKKALPQAFALEQKNILIGNVRVTISGSEARFDCLNLQSSFLVSGKSKTLSILNHRNKLYWTTAAERWQPNHFQVTNLVSYADTEVLRFKERKLDHMFCFPTQKEIFINPEHYSTPGRTNSEKLTITSAELVSCPLLTSDKTIISSAARLYSVPTGSAFPISFDSKNRKGGENHDLSTSSLARTTFDPKIMSIPPDFKKAKTQQEASLTAGASSVMEDFADIIK
jgi:hypothetical protein